MKRTLLTLAFVCAAGVVAAQTAATPSAGGEASDGSVANAPGPRANGRAAIAQRQIERDGYTNVRNLELGADGLWHGMAMRGKTQVRVTVDHSGQVMAE